ncbi:MAG: hypothetical protein V1784_12230 [bacterium]
MTRGYQLHATIWEEYRTKKANKTFDAQADRARHGEQIDGWAQEALNALSGIFPTELECHVFLNPEHPFGAVADPDYHWKCLMLRLMDLVRGLDKIRQESLPRYTDLPIKERLYVEDIDSFSRVRDVNPSMVAYFLKDGCLDVAEDAVKMALEQILDVPFHRKDSPAELDDIYTANVIVNGSRHATAFMLKGPGIGTKEMDIKHCGSKGNQLVRLFDAPADLFVIQFTGRIAEMVIKDVGGKVAALRGRGKQAHFLIMDGQDTARVLYAYGKVQCVDLALA